MTNEHALDELYRRPGFLLRRAHQISVALFLEETANLGLTTTQYGVMIALRARGDLDQASVGRWVGIDRSTSALVINRLVQLGYLHSRLNPDDKRRNIISLSADGQAILDDVTKPARRAQQRALGAFTAEDAAVFLKLLSQLVGFFNTETRAPIQPDKRKKAVAKSS